MPCSDAVGRSHAHHYAGWPARAPARLAAAQIRGWRSRTADVVAQKDARVRAVVDKYSMLRRRVPAACLCGPPFEATQPCAVACRLDCCSSAALCHARVRRLVGEYNCKLEAAVSVVPSHAHGRVPADAGHAELAVASLQGLTIA